ncbi:MAG: aspartate-semialdehyde dehydrogenase [Ignavibacteria bacterium]|jgi:aspartate-semialdehyde dehydrogenase|nr:aspartate-semialdehyde dehydrogenase [Ignavibacteria bacterium]
MANQYNIGIVGASGLVGRRIVPNLATSKIEIETLRLLATSKSVGRKFKFREQSIRLEELTETSFEGLDIALFSAGSHVSEHFVPIAVNSGCVVIDNGSYWRLDENVPLVVPEVNPDSLHHHKGIIANPNCSTIILAVPLAPIVRKYKVANVIVSTYQAISGGGQTLLNKFRKQMYPKDGFAQTPEFKDDKHRLIDSIVFHSDYNQFGRTIEEEKMVNEIHKIISPDINIIPTCVRIPVTVGHCESVTIQLAEHCHIDDVRQLLANAPGVILTDDTTDNYPSPQMCRGKFDIFVGRVRVERVNDADVISMWIAGDNLHKGAAANAIQIAEYLIDNSLLKF